MKNYCMKAKSTKTGKPAMMKNVTAKSVTAKSVTAKSVTKSVINSKPTTSTSINSSKNLLLNATTSDTSTTKPTITNSTLAVTSMASQHNNSYINKDEIFTGSTITTSEPIKAESNSTGINNAIGGFRTLSTPPPITSTTQLKALTNAKSTSNTPLTTRSTSVTVKTTSTTASTSIATKNMTTRETISKTTSTFLSTAVPDAITSREMMSTKIQTTAISTTSTISSSTPTETSTTKAIIQKNGTEYSEIETMKTISVATPNMREFDFMNFDDMEEMFNIPVDNETLYDTNITIVEENMETGWAATVADSIWNGFEYLKNAIFGPDDDEGYGSVNGYHRNPEQYENIINHNTHESLKLAENEESKENWLTSWFRDESHSEMLLSNFSLKPPNVEWDKKVLNLQNPNQASVNSTTVTPSTEFWTTENFKTLETIPPRYYSQDDSDDDDTAVPDASTEFVTIENFKTLGTIPPGFYSQDESDDDTGILVREGSGNIGMSDDFDLDKYESLLRI